MSKEKAPKGLPRLVTYQQFEGVIEMAYHPLTHSSQLKQKKPTGRRSAGGH